MKKEYSEQNVASVNGAMIVASDFYSTSTLEFINPVINTGDAGIIFFIKNEDLMNYALFINSDITYTIRKEDFYIIAIRNLRKKIRFMNLNFEYQNDDITEQDFERELEDNKSKYFVNVSLLKDETDFSIIGEIVGKINDDLTIDDVADMFSIDISTNQNLIEASTH